MQPAHTIHSRAPRTSRAAFVQCRDAKRNCDGAGRSKNTSMSLSSSDVNASSRLGDEPPNGVRCGRGTPELVASYCLMKSAWCWENGGQPISVCYIQKYVIIWGGYSRWRPPKPKYWGMCPRHPRRGWRQCSAAIVASITFPIAV